MIPLTRGPSGMRKVEGWGPGTRGGTGELVSDGAEFQICKMRSPVHGWYDGCKTM